MVHEKEGSSREVIGFEISVTRGAFDQEEGSTDDSRYHMACIVFHIQYFADTYNLVADRKATEFENAAYRKKQFQPIRQISLLCVCTQCRKSVLFS